jgi:hypothetical protein
VLVGGWVCFGVVGVYLGVWVFAVSILIAYMGFLGVIDGIPWLQICFAGVCMVWVFGAGFGAFLCDSCCGGLRSGVFF